MLSSFAQDDITIYQGNCLEVMPLLPSGSIDLVLTDPPYLVGYEGRWDSDRSQIVGDRDPSWLEPAFANIWRLLRNNSFCISFYGWPHVDLFLGLWKKIGFRPVSHLAFVKSHWGLGRFTRGRHETAFLLAKGRPPKPCKAIPDVIQWQRDRVKYHPNQKPIAALEPLIHTFCPAGGMVLDPFMGSGSTLLAAKQTGFKAIGIEISSQHCATAGRRLHDQQPIMFQTE
jgi:adenine-specific DNA-methyltransferase